MSVFGSIKDFLFGKKFVSFRKPGQPAAAAPAPSQVQPAGIAQSTPQQAAPVLQPASEATVDIAGILDQEAKASGQTLNWRQSIVDLMKVCGIDSSLQNRKALAHELGYTGDTDDSATMNIWLHRAVLNKLEENGGVVPADIRD
jgi:hypothetical protein